MVTGASLRSPTLESAPQHAKFVIPNFAGGVRFLAAIGEAGEAVGHHPEVRMGTFYVDLKLISDDAVYRDDSGGEHQVEWVT